MKKFNNQDVIKLIKEANKKADQGKLTKVSIKENLSTAEKFKISLCKIFCQYLNEKRMTSTELGQLTGIEVTRLSEITNYKINLFTVDKLLSYLQILSMHSAQVREHLNLLQESMDAPLMKVDKTKKITKKVRLWAS